jgi:hypothetical protein
MITKFKIFESENNEITFIPNDLAEYFEDITDISLFPWIKDDIKKIFEAILVGNYISFNCFLCAEDKTKNYLYRGKKHKGKVNGYGFGYNNVNKIYLDLRLSRIRHTHIVDCDKPITISGNIPNKTIDLIEKVNMFKDTKKYNL